MSQASSDLSPAHFFDTVNAYQRTAALKSAIELDIFTAIAEGNVTASAIAARCQTAERGARILGDYLTIGGFLTKEGSEYALTPDTAAFLDRKSPMYTGGALEFLLTPTLTEGFANLTTAVRKGGTALPDQGSVTPDNPVWVKFAQAMVPLMALPAQMIASQIETDPNREVKVLDIAAGHGIFGIAFAQRNPRVQVVALDWPNVLAVAEGNAQAAGVGSQYSKLPGNAFEVELGTGYDVVLLTNFLHHFDPPTNEALLKRVHAALADGGRAVTLEFIPNEDRVSPPGAAAFSIVMLASTPSGDAYTPSDLEAMFKNAGFARSEVRGLPPTLGSIVISYK
ncbi:MAG: class I SAM-dependent methyltransferase [Acidobacteriota bacterium]